MKDFIHQDSCAQALREIGIYRSSKLRFITQRWTDAAIGLTLNKKVWTDRGFTGEYVDKYRSAIQHLWIDSHCFIVEDRSGGPAKLLIEFDVPEKMLPQHWLTPDTAGQNLEEWRSALKAQTPLLLRCADAVAALNDPAEAQVSFFFNTCGETFGSLCALLELDASHLFPFILAELKKSHQQQPASRHQQFEAFPRVHWRFEKDWIPPQALSGVHSPL